MILNRGGGTQVDKKLAIGGCGRVRVEFLVSNKAFCQPLRPTREQFSYMRIAVNQMFYLFRTIYFDAKEILKFISWRMGLGQRLGQ